MHVATNAWVWVISVAAGLLLTAVPAGLYLVLANPGALRRGDVWALALVPALLVGFSPTAFLLGVAYLNEPSWGLWALGAGVILAIGTLPLSVAGRRASSGAFASLVVVASICLGVLMALGAGS